MKHLLLEDMLVVAMARALIVRCAAVVVAIIFLQSLYFKFSGHPESIELFARLKLYDAGRWAVGILELAVAVMLLVPSTTTIAALIASMIMAVAVVLHLTVLGLESYNDHGRLFVLAIVAFLFSLIVMVLSEDHFRRLLNR